MSILYSNIRIARRGEKNGIPLPFFSYKQFNKKGEMYIRKGYYYGKKKKIY